MTFEEKEEVAKALRGVPEALRLVGYIHSAANVERMLRSLGYTECLHCHGLHDAERCLASYTTKEIISILPTYG